MVRNTLIRFLLWLDSKIYDLREEYDSCYICKQPAEYWCAEGCGRRVCTEHHDLFCEDADLCTRCSDELRSTE